MPKHSQPPRISALQLAEIVVPEPVDRLLDLVYNLWWSWSPEARRLFSDIDAASWSRYRNPVELLLNVDQQRWEVLVDSDAFMNAYRRVTRSFDDYMDPERTTWLTHRMPGYGGGPVAYFSMEYGLHSSLAIYSGGLGVLSGDHLKTASDLGLPFVAVGLLYRSGYFRQAIDADGFQQHIYPEVDFTRLPLRPVLDRRGRELVVRVPMPVGNVAAKVWLAQVGRVPLLLLDTDIAENDPSERPIGNVLYVRGREMRLLQELVLGIGGVRALEALRIEPAVWHMNEGHSSLLQLERWARGLEADAATLDEVRDSVRRSTVFTTHTPVPAGNEQYERSLARRYLAPWAECLGEDVDWLLDLGAADHGEPEQAFNLSAFALRASAYANGVSRLNAEVADSMWRHLFSDRPADEPVIDAITNGVHLPTWLGRDMQDLFRDQLGTGWRERLHEEEVWSELEAVDAAAVWEAHSAQKERLLHFVRARARQQSGRHGRAPGELRALTDRISEEALIIGFARRFATYKRAGLLFSDVHRLRKLVADPARPLQIFVAGKAHPADRPGQELVRHIFRLSQELGLRGRIVFLEDYDIEAAQRLVQGVDVWLNTPQRTKEASGTSGMKAAVNGVLNCSILDGWWPEAYDGRNGWAIGAQEEALEGWEQDPKDAATLYRLLEEEILPLYFERDGSGMPTEWTDRMRHAIVSVGRRFVASRMLREYFERAYHPRMLAGEADFVVATETIDKEIDGA